ncbi:MAG: hypothetical protein PHG05_03865 [Candidatus Nanoarchaeia archaeon]|nr:hypothetical protein [Candidatus Nanoarchaeia archaeon]
MNKKKSSKESSNNKLPEDSLKKEDAEKFKEQEQLKKDLNQFKKEVLKKFDKYVLGICLLSKELPEELQNEFYKANKDLVNIFLLIDDSDSKKMTKEELNARITKIIIEVSSTVNKKFNAIPMLLSALQEACFDSKFDILKSIGMSLIIYDKGILGALKTSEIHKTMTVEKFEKYVLSYVAAGSLFRGDANPADIDVFIVIDDTDVKRMPRQELRTKLRAIIQNLGFSAAKIAGVEATFHVQTYILTDFWESLKDGNQVIFTLLRDGVPLFDRGVFLPWRLLLKSGRIKPSPEAIEFNMDIGERLLERTREKLLGILGEDLFYATLNPAQAALMLYGIPPTTPRETVKALDEIFVKKEKLLEKRYVDILERIRKYYKDIEHGKVKNVTGKEIDNILKDTEDYLRRIKKLFTQIEKRTDKEKLRNTYDICVSITRDALELEGFKFDSNKIEGSFKKAFIDKGIFPEKLLSILKELIKIKKEFDSKSKKVIKEEITKIVRQSNEYIRALVEYIERKRSYELNRVTIRFKYGDKIGEIVLLDKIAFIIDDIDKRDDISKADIANGRIINVVKSSLSEFEKVIKDAKIPARVFIQDTIFSDLKELFGSGVEILVNY